MLTIKQPERKADATAAASQRVDIAAKRNVPSGRVLGAIGPLVTRLATTPAEIEAVQKLRYEVFFRERGAVETLKASTDSRDQDGFDAVCDHLMVIDTDLPGPDTARIVGTYRLLPQDRAIAGFYSADEYDVGTLIAKRPARRFLELGRSCVAADYRSKRTAELLWLGIWAYARAHEIDVMMGCASFSGTVPAAHALALSYLHHHHLATPDWSTRALPDRHVDMDMMPVEAVDFREAVAAMPPLVKAYLRLGAMVADGCVVDPHFATTDIFIILPVETIPDRYIRYYSA